MKARWFELPNSEKYTTRCCGDKYPIVLGTAEIIKHYVCNDCGRQIYLHPENERKYKNHCWNCKHPINSEIDKERCGICGWFICPKCGSCKPNCKKVYMSQEEIAEYHLQVISEYEARNCCSRPYDPVLDGMFDGDRELMESNMPDFD